LKLGIIGDHFMHPDHFRMALETAGLNDRLTIESMVVDWPLGRQSTKKDPSLPVSEFLGRPEEYFDFIADKDILLIHTAPVTAASLERAPNLKLVGIARGGPVNVELPAAKARGVKVVNTPGRNASAVADFTIASIMAGLRHLVEAHHSVADGSFSRRFYHRDFVGRELSEVTVGVIGYGAIGRKVVRILTAFGSRVLVYDPYASLDPNDEAQGARLVSFDEVIAQSDVVTLHPRVTPETRGMISRDVIGRMKHGAFIVNTTRGEILDYDALYDGLTDGRLSGAALDTFPNEPPAADMPLLQLPNVILSPHIAGASRRSIDLAAEMLTEEVVRFLDGRPAIYPV
jgi:D-3-phosphoglycerate dehydrogenase / 2-oxoglutarate reductase